MGLAAKGVLRDPFEYSGNNWCNDLLKLLRKFEEKLDIDNEAIQEDKRDNLERVIRQELYDNKNPEEPEKRQMLMIQTEQILQREDLKTIL